MTAADDERSAEVVVLDRRPLYGRTAAHLSALLRDAWRPGGADVALDEIDARLASCDSWYAGRGDRRQVLADVLADLRTLWALVAWLDGGTDEVPVLSCTVFGAPAGAVRITRPPLAVPADLSGIRIGFPPEREEC